MNEGEFLHQEYLASDKLTGYNYAMGCDPDTKIGVRDSIFIFKIHHSADWQDGSFAVVAYHPDEAKQIYLDWEYSNQVLEKGWPYSSRDEIKKKNAFYLREEDITKEQMDELERHGCFYFWVLKFSAKLNEPHIHEVVCYAYHDG